MCPLLRFCASECPRPGHDCRACALLRGTERIELALASRDWLLVEAGTGTGKTFAYLVPALLSGLKVLDLYAGSGALGIEAVSRGAGSVGGDAS